MKTMYDNTSLLVPEPNTDVLAFYIGGNTPHVWTIDELNRSTRRYRLPTYVRSYPGVNPHVDSGSALTRLSQIGAPKGISTALDVETMVNPPYVSAYGADLHNAGYRVLVYGSLSVVTGNPALDGLWVADWDGVQQWDADDPIMVKAIQWQSFANYDLSIVMDDVPLWDTQGAELNTTPGTMTTDVNGNAVFVTNIPKDKIVSVAVKYALTDTVAGSWGVDYSQSNGHVLFRHYMPSHYYDFIVYSMP